MVKHVVVAMVLCCTGCDSAKSESKAADVAPSAAAASAKSVAAASSSAKTAGSSAAGDKPATDAGTGDEDVCEQAFAQVKLVIEGFAAIPGNQTKLNVPDKDTFLAGCKTLPAEVQECLKVADLMRDQKKLAECNAKLDKLPEDVKQRATELMEQAKGK